MTPPAKERKPANGFWQVQSRPVAKHDESFRLYQRGSLQLLDLGFDCWVGVWRIKNDEIIGSAQLSQGVFDRACSALWPDR